MKFGSVCSGIEAASVAWHPLGWKAAWLSEIEPFPSAVLAHHYPDVPNLGDMTTLPDRIISGEVEAPDVFCGGTPCQAFSVAGLRKSLDDARGNLSLIFCEIANAIDVVRVRAGKPAAIVFWENVPGVLSTQDNAFGCFLAGLAGEDDPIEPPGKKWTGAGVVLGPQRAVAWRILDAQYFGVAQRRRRVFVVASARNDFDPAAVLFEFDGLRRDSAPSRQAGEKIAPCVTNGPPFSRTGNERVEAEAMVAVRMVAFGEYVDDGTASAMKARDYKDATDLEAQPIPIDMRNAGRDPEKHDEMNRQGVGVGEPGDPAHTVTSAFVHGVAQPIAFHPTQDPISSKDGTTHGLGCGSSGGQASVAVAFQHTADCLTAAYGTKWNGNASATNGSLFAAQPVTAAFKYTMGAKAHGIGYAEEQSPTLDTKADSNAVLTPATAVRRLTPTECERLQGFPDGYTNIPWRKKDESPDGPRYKALGNSWAVPVVRWIGKRIDLAVAIAAAANDNANPKTRRAAA